MTRAKIDLQARLAEQGCTAEARTRYDRRSHQGFVTSIWEDATDAAHTVTLTSEKGWERFEIAGHRCPCGEWLPAAATAAQWAGHWRGVQCRIGAEKYRLALEEDIAEIARELTAPLEKRGIEVTHSESYTVGGFVGKRGDVKTNRYVSAESLRDFLQSDKLTERQQLLAKQALAEHAAIRAGVRPWMRETWRGVQCAA